ncbi:lasso peptide biosynthesis B2 protein [Streptomyces mobaraensis NBRC 13819 = DSM 40847]|uniref:Lasso peptide biosynthesis B2 protein n=2 Tax=Streptomyces mobaraensis TaxID=35621 RepID=A0A5N5W1R0_STRMB|nr:lasso peptide biosynthesis B2 protein [Streptomyces mobaraensis]EMF00610.1 hypothetical protein H340_10610 [Streptomyces mobaraensis NBRC 13819 = DSM 40847]KAB7836032.1 lasso peptide biosynthesis B2 protein [Streptomyces mobaraensis]QTT75903.1 lasso peptide biosynthesis B2 protein [Streptomyces mobaraensis NBRC 13819 = DSM 40847]
MTTEMTMPARGAGRGGPALRVVIALAFLLARLRPGRLRRLLTLISRGARPAHHAEVLEVYQAVVGTSRRCAGWYGCLPRSVAIALVCRLSGTWPDWCAGVRSSPPFAAHAWVEADGRPVGERGRSEDFRPLMVVTVREGGSGAGDRRGAGRR